MEMNGSLVLALWLPDGKWEYRIDPPRVAKGQKHVHVRRIRKRTGEYAWNMDGTRHDKGKFPLNGKDIERAKEIAASKLGISKDIFEISTFVTEASVVNIASRFSTGLFSIPANSVVMHSECSLVIVTLSA